MKLWNWGNALSAAKPLFTQRCGIFASTVLASQIVWSSALLAQDLQIIGTNGFEVSTAYSKPLLECVIARRGEGTDISVCVGLVEELCVSDTVSNSLRLVCLLEEQFAWTDILSATVPDLIGVAEGKTIISSSDYIDELSERFARLREKCFSFPRDQIEKAERCQIDAAVNDVAWHFDLYDNGR